MRTPENDLSCLQACKRNTYLHAMDCPYTKERWKRQGLQMIHQFNTHNDIPNPQQIREEYAKKQPARTL